LASEPGLLFAGLGKDTAAFDRPMRWAVLDHHEHPVGRNIGDPRHSGRDFRCEKSGFVFRVTGSHPAVNQHRIRGYTVGVNPAGGQLVENDVDIGARHMIDLGVDARYLVSQRALDAAVSVDVVVVQV
jgi:hypothetical protein